LANRLFGIESEAGGKERLITFHAVLLAVGLAIHLCVRAEAHYRNFPALVKHPPNDSQVPPPERFYLRLLCIRLEPTAYSTRVFRFLATNEHEFSRMRPVNNLLGQSASNR